VTPRRRLAAVLLLAFVLSVSCAPSREDIGRALPADTLFWLRLERLDTLEASLDRLGLWELLVARLQAPEVRRGLQDKLGLALSDDPRADVHAVLAMSRRADLTLHPVAAGAAPAELGFFGCLEARDAAAAGEIAAIISGAAARTEVWDETTVQVLETSGRPAYLLREGPRLLLANDAALMKRLLARLASPPDRGLAGTDAYRRLARDEDRDVSVYFTPAFQSATRWPLGGPATMPAPAILALMEKYGSQTCYFGADFLLTTVVSRTALEPESALAPLFENPSRRSRLIDWLPADTYAAEVVCVHDGARKLALIEQLYRDLLAAVPAGEAMPLAANPFDALDVGLGIELADLADLVEEFAIAAAPGPGLVLLARTRGEADAERLLGAISSAPLLGLLAEGESRQAGGVTMRTFTAVMDPKGRAIALGRKDATVLVVVGPRSPADLDAFLVGLGGGALPEAAVQPARRQLAADGHAWFYLDAAGLVSTWDIPIDRTLAQVPAPLAQRLRTLVVGGHVVSRDAGVAETVIEFSGP